MKHAIVIPCYNEVKRINTNAFARFVEDNPAYVLCFVNDGSTDQTMEVLTQLQRGREEQIKIFDMPANGGKAEAVRNGVRYMLNSEISSVGFIDADLSTNFNEYQALVDQLDVAAGGKKMIFGSRKAGEPSGIQRSAFRSLASDAVGTIIRQILQMPIADTQCGAKVFSPELAEFCFRKPFVTRWLFDVELFMRAKLFYGQERVMHKICEVPLKQWVEVEGSKITVSDSLNMPSQLAKIVINYQLAPLAGNLTRSAQGAGTRLMTTLNLL